MPWWARASRPASKACSPLERAAEVERADEPVEARAERQLDERRRRAASTVASAGDGPVGRELAGRERERPGRARRVTGGSSGASAAHRRRLGRAALAAHEHAADLGRDGVDQQRLDQRLLADDRRQRVRHGSRAGLLELALEREVAVADRRRACRPPGSPTCPRSAASSSRSAIARAAHGLELRHELGDVVVEQVALARPARTSSPRPRRSSRRSRRGSRRWPTARPRPCSRGGSSTRSSAGWRRARGTRGASPRRGCARRRARGRSCRRGRRRARGRSARARSRPCRRGTGSSRRSRGCRARASRRS